MKAFFALSLLSLTVLAADPQYLPNTLKGLAHVNTFTRANYTFIPGRIENCKDGARGLVCEVKDGSINFEQGSTRGSMLFTTVNILDYTGNKFPELPDVSYIFRGTYTDNLPSDGTELKYTLTLTTKGNDISGIFASYDKLYSTEVSRLFVFGKK